MSIHDTKERTTHTEEDEKFDGQPVGGLLGEGGAEREKRGGGGKMETLLRSAGIV